MVMHAHMHPLCKQPSALWKNPVRSGEFEDRDAFRSVPTSTQLLLHHSEINQHTVGSGLILDESPRDRVMEKHTRCHPGLETLRKLVVCQRSSVIGSINIGEDEPGWVESFRFEVGLGTLPGCSLGQSKTDDVHWLEKVHDITPNIG